MSSTREAKQIPPKQKYFVAAHFELSTSETNVTKCTSLSNGKVIVAVGSRDQVIELHDIHSKTITTQIDVPHGATFWNPFENTLSHYYGSCGDLFPLPDGRVLNSGKILDSSSLATLETIPSLTELCFNNAILMGNCVVTFGGIGYYQAVNIFDLETRQSKRIAPGSIQREGWIHSIAALSDTRLALAVGHKIAVFDFNKKSFDLENGKFYISGVEQLAPSSSRHFLLALPGNRLLSIGIRDGGAIKLWDTSSMTCIAESKNSIAVKQQNKLRLLPDGNTVISIGVNTNELCIWNLRTLKPHLIDFKSFGEMFTINDFDVLPNGQAALATEQHGLLIIEFNHILNLKIKSQILSESTTLDQDTTSIVLEYIDASVNVSGYSMGLFGKSGKNLLRDRDLFLPKLRG